MRFEQIIGQEKAKDTFFKMVNEGRIPHAMILKGADGVGKLPFAKAIAQFLNCEDPTPTDSCGKCASCSKISKAIHPDLHFILPIISKREGGKQWTTEDYFIDFRNHFLEYPYMSMGDWVEILGGENKQLSIHIHEIRELKRKMSLKAFEGNHKIVIIWNAERINPNAANALLKLLEEPPEKTHIILTVQDPSQLLTTIDSRCQRLVLHRIKEEEIVKRLVKNHGITEEHATQIAQISDGSIARADELVKETTNNILELYKTWLRNCYEGNYEAIHEWTSQMARENKEFQKMFLSFGVSKLRDSMLFSFQVDQLALVTDEERKFHQDFAKLLNVRKIEDMVRLTENALHNVSRNANSQMVFSVLCLQVHGALHGKVFA